jgi:serine/tyrosine/threonine adenylyltransferase
VTLDYGPFGFMDEFDPDFICNHSDHTGRYSFDNQPQVLMWNLERLARALIPILEYETSSAILEQLYWTEYNSAYCELMRKKMGLFTSVESDSDFNDNYIVRILGLLSRGQVDWTIFWRKLARANTDPAIEQELIKMFDTKQKKNVSEPPRMKINTETMEAEELEAPTVTFFRGWLQELRERQQKENGVTEEQRTELMLKSSPKYILRNYLAQQAIKKAEAGDFSEVNKLFEILKRPFDEHPEHEADYAKAAPDWSKKICVSCSS